ncbi:hypothetical protein EOI86_08095 [Hwanghaeella grinnelliae]|uniref:DUF6898 domain-containing protein n=1 Tax=Hwanghaeella grinnelliae TaxID=2500179 RepID=A0A437QXD2_9PROT|nr:hypothetical protein [Hwanghaeella grinnelliae]RVU39197.1 hypothetical protein EOI86_08095 [Hwanghaeella grinnelliae]
MTEKFQSKLLPQGALIEYIPRGAYVKVCAVDPVTREEVSIVGDARSGSKRLSQEAVKKLEYVLRRKLEQKAAGQSGASGPANRSKRSETPSGWDL